jgi:hypothetical protein
LPSVLPLLSKFLVQRRHSSGWKFNDLLFPPVPIAL